MKTISIKPHIRLMAILASSFAFFLFININGAGALIQNTATPTKVPPNVATIQYLWDMEHRARLTWEAQLPSSLASREASSRMTQESALTLEAQVTFGPYLSPTPDLRPTSTPYYGPNARQLGSGILLDPEFKFSPSHWFGIYFIASQWKRNDPLPAGTFRFEVFTGMLANLASNERIPTPTTQGVVLVVENTDYHHPLVYRTAIQDGEVEIVDASGLQLVLRTRNSGQILYFDVDRRQFIPALNTPTYTPTSTFTPAPTSTPTRTPIPTRTLTPTPKPTQYPITIQGLRRMLRDLHDRGQVNDGIYRALDMILISAARQVAYDNEFVAIAELRAFVKIVDAQSGKQIKPEAAEQLTTHAYKVMEKLREDDDHRDED